MKAILTAIQPPHTTNIFNGIKIIEWRTFPMPDGLHYVYETKRNGGTGLVIGTFERVRAYSFNDVDEIPEYMIEAGCVGRDFLRNYAKGRKLYANIIVFATLLDKPKPYTDFKKYIDPEKPIKRRYKRSVYSKGFGYTPFLKRRPADEIRMPPQSYIYIEV